jgi:predicted nucleotidyltransferase
VWKALGRLVEAGLVNERRRPSETLYRLNREHVLYPAVIAALDAGRDLRARIAQLAETGGSDITVLLFGSVARGEATGDSDVDLLVLGDRDETELSELRDAMAARVESWTGNRASVIVLGRAALDQMFDDADPLAESWLTDGILIAGPPLQRTT